MQTYSLPSVKWLAAASLAFVFALSPAIAPAAHADTSAMVTAPVSVPGAPATITASGFLPGETVHITFGARSTDVVADGAGAVSNVSLPIPTVPASLQFASTFGETSGRWALGYIWIAGFNPMVSPSAWYILPGTPLTFSGVGFAPNETVTATYNNTTLGTFTTNASGSFNGAASSTLPISLSNTTATITFTGGVSKAATAATITIGQLYPNITPSSWYTGAGTAISLSGSGFAANEPVLITAGSIHATSSTDATGSFTLASLTLPKSASTVTINAIGGLSGATGVANITLFTLTPWLTFSTYWAQGGSPLTVYGNNFVPGESVSVMSGSTAMGTVTANTQGNFAFTSTVPFAPAGTISITATGADSGASAASSLTVAPVYTDLQLLSYAGAPGAAITFIGHGYLPNEPVVLTSDRTGSSTAATWTADANGNFSNASFVVPSNWLEGILNLTVTGLHSFSSKSITYYVTGQ